ncbi:MAG: aspartate/glutamate racemase family protein, partial [Sciscionella sp.]
PPAGARRSGHTHTERTPMSGARIDPEHLVGILGGMGPAATADFYAKLIRRTPASRDAEHLRVIIWADPTVPDRVAAVLAGSTDPYPALRSGAGKLAMLGATVVAMPCHTAHVYLDRLAADSGLTFLDMVGETVSYLAAAFPSGGVGILGTRATLHSGLYQDRCAAKGIDTVLPTDPIQRVVDGAIAGVKSGDLSGAGAQLDAALRSMASRGAGTIVLACTELPLARRNDDDPAPGGVLDPTDLLADAVVRHCLLARRA